MFNRKGLVQQIMIVIILFIVFVVLLAGYWLISMVGPIIVGEGTAVSNQIQTSININQGEASDMANASSVATSLTKNVLGTFELLVYFLIIGMILGYGILAYHVRTYPFLGVFWIFIVIFMVVFAMIISNAYQTAAKTSPSDVQAFYSTWGTNDFLMTNLPIIVTVVGLLGGILLFVLISREPESEVMPI